MTRIGLPALTLGNARTGVVYPQRSVRVSGSGQTTTQGQAGAASWAEVAIPGLILGTVDRDIDQMPSASETLSWASVGIPSSYDGSTTLPTPPAGYGWLYLGDSSSEGYGPWSPLSVGDLRPLLTTRGVSAFRLLRAFIDPPYTNKDSGYTRPSGTPGPSKSTLYLVFSSRAGSVQARDVLLSGSDTSKERLAPLNTYTISAFTNVITVQLNREVSEDEVVTVSINRDVTSSQGYTLAGESTRFVFVRHPRYQQILCRNASTDLIPESARVVVSRIEWESDPTNSAKGTRPVAIVTQVGSGGSGGTSLTVCSVLGGNDYSTSGTTRPYSLPLPLDPAAPVEVPTVSDWSKYDLPDTWSPGDTVPQMPAGLCYLKVSRPGTIGTALWYGDLPGDPVLTTTTSVPEVSFAATLTPFSTVRVTWSSSSVVLASKNPIGVSLVSSNSKLGPIKATAFAVSGRTMQITLSRPIQPKLETVLLLLPAGIVTNKVGAMTYKSLTFRGTVAYKSVAATAVFGLNRWAMQVYQAGDLVVVDKKAIQITDTKGVTRSVYDVLHSASPGVRPHSHSLVAVPPTFGVSNVL